MLVKGLLVEVTYLQGTEIGEADSVNYQEGKILNYFNYEPCPHLTSYNLNQIKPIKSRFVNAQENSVAEHKQDILPRKKSKMANLNFYHLIKIMDRKIKDLGNYFW